MKRLVLFLIIMAMTGSLTALRLHAQPTDTLLTASILTCSPGQETYELYGHTGLRMRRGGEYPMDLVFNYGVFSFNQPHFVWRFVLGECDYMVAPMPFDDFLEEYKRRGSSVTEQVLNLHPYEADSLMRALLVNCQKENRVYRYNIFRNNCTTRVRDIVEQCIDGAVIYPVRPRRLTFRQILHQFTDGHPWAQEGNDLLLGADVDTLLLERDEMFAPIYLMNYVDSAMIATNHRNFRPLVSQRNMLLQENPKLQQIDADMQGSFPLTPAELAWSVFVFLLFLGAFEVHAGRIYYVTDILLLGFQGVAGVLVAFMVLFSSHPSVGSNWQVLVLNPIPLLALPFVVSADRCGQRCIYHHVAATYLTFFIAISPFIKQDFSLVLMPLALSLLCRAATHIVLYRTQKSKTH